MTASIKTNGDGTTTITFAYTALTQKISDLGEDAAHQVFIQNPPASDPFNPTPLPTWNDLTNQQKLDLLDREIKGYLLMLARIYYIRRPAEAANVQALLMPRAVTCREALHERYRKITWYQK